jgi:hypothetical protein
MVIKRFVTSGRNPRIEMLFDRARCRHWLVAAEHVIEKDELNPSGFRSICQESFVKNRSARA